MCLGFRPLILSHSMPQYLWLPPFAGLPQATQLQLNLDFCFLNRGFKGVSPLVFEGVFVVCATRKIGNISIRSHR